MQVGLEVGAKIEAVVTAKGECNLALAARVSLDLHQMEFLYVSLLADMTSVVLGDSNAVQYILCLAGKKCCCHEQRFL